METFSPLLTLCTGNSPVTDEFLTKVFSLICPWINGRVNNREAGDLRHLRTHYDVTAMPLSTAVIGTRVHVNSWRRAQHHGTVYQGIGLKYGRVFMLMAGTGYIKLILTGVQGWNINGCSCWCMAGTGYNIKLLLTGAQGWNINVCSSWCMTGTGYNIKLLLTGAQGWNINVCSCWRLVQDTSSYS